MDENAIRIIQSLRVALVFSGFAIFSLRRQNRQMQEVIIQAADIMEKDTETIKYLLHLLDKHNVVLEDFDYIALKELGIVVTES